MEIFYFIVSLILIKPIWTQILSKCCPMQYELYVESDIKNITSSKVSCKLTNSTMLMALNSQSLVIGLPNCNISVVDAYRRDTKIACLDRIVQLNDIYAVRCSDNETQNVYDIVSIANLRKCCPFNRNFNWDKQYCWNEYADDYTNAATDLMKLIQNGDYKFVNLSFGTPRCRKSDVLVDKILHREDVEFLDTDAILINESNNQVILSFDEYCVDLVDDRFEFLAIRSCHDYITACKHDSEVCVRKCCPVGYELFEDQCVSTTRPLSLTFYDLNVEKGSQIVTNVIPAFFQGSSCTRGKYPIDHQQKPIITTDGMVFTLATNTVIDINSYCVDNVKFQRETRTFACSSGNVFTMIRELKIMMTSVCAAISAFFLLLTFFIYLTISSLRNLHGQLIMCYLISSAVSYITVVIHRTVPLHKIPQELCQMAGFVMLFATLSSFSWLNIISCDIWSTFRITRSTFLKKSKTCNRLILYGLYGWGYPLAWSIFTYSSKYIFKKHNTSTWKTDIGIKSCWFSENETSRITYFIAPISVMLLFNAAIFIIIAKHCFSVKAELYNTNNSNYSLRKYTANKNDLMVMVKLFVLMGLNWSLEIIALVVNPQHRIFFILSDVLNASTGFIVFCILIMKPKVLHDLHKILCGSGWKCGNNRTSHIPTSSSNLQSARNSRSVNRF